MDESCFFGCTSLSSIDLSDNLEALSRLCFKNCSNLSSITVPASVKTVGDWCFQESGLSSITMLPPTPPATNEDVLYSIEIFLGAPLRTIYVVDEKAKALYEAALPWNRYDIVALQSGIDDVQLGEDEPRITDFYDLSGKKLNGTYRGPAIVRYHNGTTRKVMMQ